MTSKEFLDKFNSSMNVGQLIEKLKSYDPKLPVVNVWNDKEPISWVGKQDIGYCSDEIIVIKVVSILQEEYEGTEIIHLRLLRYAI